MSRIVLKRHPGGDEKVVVGYDRPMATFFAHEYAEADGECVKDVGITEVVSDPGTLERLSKERGIDFDLTDRLAGLLREHAKLDYPASNIEVDLAPDVS